MWHDHPFSQKKREIKNNNGGEDWRRGGEGWK